MPHKPYPVLKFVPSPVSGDKASIHEKARAWIEQVLARKGWTGTDLAREMESAPSTVLRMVSGASTYEPPLTVIERVYVASGILPPESLLAAYGVRLEETSPGATVLKVRNIGEMRDEGPNIYAFTLRAMEATRRASGHDLMKVSEVMAKDIADNVARGVLPTAPEVVFMEAAMNFLLAKAEERGAEDGPAA